MSASELSADDFVAFFRAVYGFDPFPWQARLLRQVAETGVWPDVLDLPTGSGKTAALDIAVFHLALDMSREGERRAPVRIAFVVDRRLIVDDAFERAQKLADTLQTGMCDPIVGRVSAALCRLAGADQKPLLVRRLRGGMPREDDWARTPIQPTILCSTVDQVGSRLLFRGYGVSDRMKPVHAGLLGSDCLLLLDEAHLSKPFRQTLAAIERLRKGDASPWATALLTATPEEKGRRPFGLDDDDRAHPLLALRLRASKPARMVEITAKQGMAAEDRRVAAIVEHVEATVGVLRNSGIVTPAVGVVVNRVARARAVFERLRGKAADNDLTLIIGPARGVDREARSAELSPIRTRASGAPRVLQRPLIVVATQTIEAGVDIDLDGLVTEVAALDSLRQRFGRLNRAGCPFVPVAVIVADKEDIGAKADDPVYGDRGAETWRELQTLAAASSEDMVDLGVETIGRRLKPERIAELAAPNVDAPVLLPAYVHLWSHTSPVPNADPEVALFLHGLDRSPASVQIVWRADIAAEDLVPAERDRLGDLLKLVPPRAAEAIEVPVWAARAWLQRRYEALNDLSDAPERRLETDERTVGRRVLRYRGDSPEARPISVNEIRPGDLIIVPAAYGGCDQWGWNPASDKQVMDVAEAAALPYRARRVAVRVTPELIRQWEGGEEGDEHFGEASLRLSSALAENVEERTPLLLESVLGLALPQSLHQDLASLRNSKVRLEHRFTYGFDEDERPRGIIFLAPFGLRNVREGDDGAWPATEADDLGSAPGFAQLLDEHSIEVKEWARAFSVQGGLSAVIAADLALAAYLHDAGKLDPRFQAYLAGGDPFGWDERKVMAKSGWPVLPRNSWERAGLPDNWRHEALSVRLARLHPHFAEAKDPALVLWLVGVHHGFGRPLFPHADPWDERNRADLPRALGIDWRVEPGSGPQSLAFEFEGRDWAQIFEDLKRRYGVWGLARLEAFVRLADHRASEAAARRCADRPSAEGSR
jgi:CRISPR-associated endonuclease/helicase Cas3